jgi:hypothetical protein
VVCAAGWLVSVITVSAAAALVVDVVVPPSVRVTTSR